MTRVGIVGYGMGNIMSLTNAFDAIDVAAFVATAPEALRDATHVVLPGVGAFPTGMQHLRELGFDAELRTSAAAGVPVLGICLGMQLLASSGEEHGDTEGVGLVPGCVKSLTPTGLRVPHIGWNDAVVVRDNRLGFDRGDSPCFYFVHSYHLVPDDERDVVMTCRYGTPFVAAVQRGTVFGAQFHPEKSRSRGLALLKAFSEVKVAQAAAHPVLVPAERADRP